MNTNCVGLGLSLLVVVAGVRGATVEETEILREDRLGLRVAAGSLALPKEGVWRLVGVEPVGSMAKDVFLQPPAAVLSAVEGDRMGALGEGRQIEARRNQLHMLFWASRNYALRHEGRGPAHLQDVDTNQGTRLASQGGDTNLFLIPGVSLRGLDRTDARRNEPEPDRTLLAFEVRPVIDDGKHWVLWNDGQVERVLVDAEMVARHGTEVRALGPSRRQRLKEVEREATVRYRVFGRLTEGGTPQATLQLRRDGDGEVMEVGWDLATGASGDAGLLREWAGLRAGTWLRLLRGHPTMVLSLWLDQASELYGMEAGIPEPPAGPGPRGNEETILGVVGGRAAIRETLQLQDLQARDAAEGAAGDVPIETVAGVTVKAHRYEEMLAGRPGGRLPMAEVVPPDRFLAYFPKPTVLMSLLETGGGMAAHLGLGVGGESIRYDLLDRYVTRLGLTREQMRSMLQSGAISELAILLPDLFLVDGTEMTVIARVQNLGLLGSLLKLAGLGEAEGVSQRELPGRGRVVWCRRGDWLFLSSNESELRECLRLQEKQGEGSLGRSAEFRYMLEQLGPQATTEAYIYFSDPFLRRLTGPATKIAQYRRVLTRAQLEATTAGALLYTLDHDRAPASAATLFELGYARRIPGVPPTDITLRDGCVAESARYGSSAGLRTLLEVPVVLARRNEVAAYESYRENYERFWRQFFDPIALRLDRVDSNRMELATFILPLIDSSFYTGLRGALARGEDRTVLAKPVLEPEPVALLSANVTEAAWLEWLRGLDHTLQQVLGGRSSLLDQLGPCVHLALADDDPMIATGSGDLLGSFGSGPGRVGGEMFMIPVAVAMFTRPSSLVIEVQDPVAVRRELDQMATGTWGGSPGWLGLTTSLYRIADREEWIFGLSVERLFTVRFGISLQGKYLLVSNLPLTHHPRVVGTRRAVHNGLSLRLAPRAADLLLPSLFESAMVSERQAAMRGIGMLYPLLASRVAELELAPAVHQRLFGFAPLHPDGGGYVRDGDDIASTRFGKPGAERQPAFSPGFRDFGFMRGVEAVDVGMQFEQDGLRAQAAWTFRP